MATDDLGLPDLMLLLAIDIAAVDHHEGTIPLIANAVNWNETGERVDQAYDDPVARTEVMTDTLAQTPPSTVSTFSRPTPLHRAQRTAQEYRTIVDRLVDEIKAGELFQVMPSQRFEMDTDADPIDVYRMLWVSNLSPYMYLLNVPNDAGTWTSRSSDPVRKRWSPSRAAAPGPTRSPARGGAKIPKKKTSYWRRICCPTT